VAPAGNGAARRGCRETPAKQAVAQKGRFNLSNNPQGEGRVFPSCAPTINVRRSQGWGTLESRQNSNNILKRRQHMFLLEERYGQPIIGPYKQTLLDTVYLGCDCQTMLQWRVRNVSLVGGESKNL
jgi:hypothetical protein